MKKMIECTAAALLAVSVLATPAYHPVEAKEVVARDGIGNFIAKAKAGKPVTVVYFGGSITAMNGWRNKTSEWIQKTYPQAKVIEVPASIGGTASGLGVYRLKHDALQHNPDLLFVEFATNDGTTEPNSLWRSMEGIVRQTWEKDPATDIVFTYTITKSMTNDYCRGFCNQAASVMEILADHYGIPSVNFGPRVAGLLKANKLIMDAKEIETAVPKQSADHDKEILARAHLNGRILFSNDSVHPRDEGHTLYLESITNAFTQMAGSKPVNHAAKLATPFVADNDENAKMVAIEPSMLSGAWRRIAKGDKNLHFTNRTDAIWFAEAPGSALTFKFRGKEAKLYDLLGPDCGQFYVTVDGVTGKDPIRLFDSYCTYYRLACHTLYTGSDPNAVHTVKLVLDSKQPDRKSISFRLKDPAKELAAPKYQGTTFWVGALLIDGELVK